MTTITLKSLIERRACYSRERLEALFDRPYTPLEVLTNQHGPWADVPDDDRLLAVLHKGVIDDRTLRLFACDCAERALERERKAGRKPHADSWKAIEVARRFADGKATNEELKAARSAAAAASNASNAAAAYAYAAAAYAAAYAYAASNASAAYASNAAASAAYAANAAAAYAAERRWQVERLVQMLKGGA